jgi:glycerol-3-phosphate dehydrogenase
MTYSQLALEKFKKAVITLGARIHNKANATSAISRNHVIEFTPSGLVSVMGGKWTTFRQIGHETVDMILKDFK